jgi:hypothetical protein
MSQRRRTVLRTIRISSELDAIIQRDAKERRLSVNALISMIMIRYAEWDRYNERFGIISLKRDAFAQIINKLEDKAVISLAEDIGQEVPRQFILFWFKKLTLETYLAYLSLVCRYAYFAEYELEVTGTDYTVSLIHDLGMKWSHFLGKWMEVGMKTTIGVLPKYDVTKGSVVIRFHV